MSGIFDERVLADALNKLETIDITPLLSDIGDILLLSIDDNISEGGRFAPGEGAAGTVGAWMGGSQKFPPLAESTAKQKVKRGRNPENILQDTGRMLAAFDKEVSGNTLEITNNVEYFPFVTLGTRDGKLPPRPVLVVQPEDMEEIEKAAEEFVVKAIEGR